MSKYAIICTGSWGDVINTTPLASQIREANPYDEIHWYVSSMYASALENNPNIDKLFILPSHEKSHALFTCTEQAKKQAAENSKIYNYRTIFAPAPYANHHWGEQRLHIVDCIKQSCMDTLPSIQWLVPWIPILNLTNSECTKAHAWILDKFQLHETAQKLAIFEYDAKSGQCQLQSSWIPEICKLFGPEWLIALSGVTPIQHQLPSNAIYAGDLSIRETAELFNHAKFMIGVSSGISAACSSTWTQKHAKTMPWIEICNNILWSGTIYKHAPRTIYTSDNLQTLLSLIRPLVKNA